MDTEQVNSYCRNEMKGTIFAPQLRVIQNETIPKDTNGYKRVYYVILKIIWKCDTDRLTKPAMHCIHF